MSAVDTIARSVAALQGHFQVGPDARLYGPRGDRFYMRGVQIYNDCFALFMADGFRQNCYIRYSQKPATIASVSPPINNPATGGAWLGTAYVSADTCRAYLASLKSKGVNSVWIWVGIGMIETQPFTDSVTGLSFPSEPEILDTIVQTAAQLGMAVVLRFATGSLPTTPADAAAAGTVGSAQEFWGWMAARYRSHWNVFFDIQNEPGLGNIWYDVNNPSATKAWNTVMTNLADWETRHTPLVNAIRSAGFRNPIMVQPYDNLWTIGTIASALDSVSPFNTDPNLMVSVHPYYIYGNTATTFESVYPGLFENILDYCDYHCVVAGEVGFTNDFNYADSTAAQLYLKKLFVFLQSDKINGFNAFTTQPQHDNLNDIFNSDGTYTTWGSIVSNYGWNAAQGTLQMVPTVLATSGTITDASQSYMSWRRNEGGGLKVDVNLCVNITTNGTGAGAILVELPMMALTDRHQMTTSAWGSNGAAVRTDVCGRHVTLTTLSNAYPGADGRIIFANFSYYAQGPGFAYTPFTFDGATYLTRGATLTGVSNGQKGTAVFAIKPTAGDGVQQTICATSNSHFTILRDVNNCLQLQLRNATGTLIGQWTSANVFTVANGRQRVMIAWDLSVPTMSMYVNGSLNGSATTGPLNDTIGYSDVDFAIGGTVGGTNLLSAALDCLFIDLVNYNDPSNGLNFKQFFDYKIQLVNLGRYGFRPGQSLPAVFCRVLDSTTSFYTNNGSGGGFTKHP